MDKVVDVAHLAGWEAAHFRPALVRGVYRTPCQYDAVGFPDLFLLHPRSGDRLALELKIWERRNAGKPEHLAAQARWLTNMNGCGIEAHMRTDRDFDELIVPRLMAPTNARTRP